jgi:hypothetical protein
MQCTLRAGGGAQGDVFEATWSDGGGTGGTVTVDTTGARAAAVTMAVKVFRASGTLAFFLRRTYLTSASSASKSAQQHPPPPPLHEVRGCTSCPNPVDP